MNWSEIKIWYLLAGLGIFLYGISLLEDAIKALTGRTFKTFLQKQTGHPVKAVIAGALTTGVMQSSSMVTLLVMSFTGSGIIGLKNGIGMILGANLGTTVTGWIVALLGFKFNLENFYLPVTAIGSLITVFYANGKAHQAGKLIFGFGLMFMGLQFMKEGFFEFAQNADLNTLVGKPLVLFLLFGFVLAAAIRSSAASMVIFLTSLAAGSINLTQAAYLAIGADLGTTVTGILGTINGNHIRKKTGWSQFYINVITAFFTIILLKPILFLIGWAGIKDPLVALVTFHSSFNLLGIIIILPFLGKLTGWLDRFIGSDQKMASRFLPFINPKDTLTSIDALDNETLLFINKATGNRNIFYNDSDVAFAQEQYFDLKTYENEIFNLCSPLFHNPLEPNESNAIQKYFSSIRSATLSVKALKDVKHNLEEIRKSADDEIFNLYTRISEMEKQFNKVFENQINSKIDDEIIADLNEINESDYSTLKSDAFGLYHKNQNFDLASLLNLLREVKDSKKLLLTAVKEYLEAKMILKRIEYT